MAQKLVGMYEYIVNQKIISVIYNIIKSIKNHTNVAR